MISFSSIYNKLITENVNISDISSAIDNKNVVEIRYNTGDGKATGLRKIEIHGIGENERGNVVLDAYQLSGDSKTYKPDWKTFDIRNITDFKILDQTFDRPRPKWKENGNKKIVNFYKKVNF